jgi:hypothetical protein
MLAVGSYYNISLYRLNHTTSTHGYVSTIKLRAKQGARLKHVVFTANGNIMYANDNNQAFIVTQSGTVIKEFNDRQVTHLSVSMDTSNPAIFIADQTTRS